MDASDTLSNCASFFILTFVVMAALCGLGVVGGLILAHVRMKRVKKIMDEELSK
jgi:hypothetical protein